MNLLPAFTGQPELDRVYCMDAETFLSRLASQSIDIVITSPPYNLRNSTGGYWRSKDTSSKWSNAALRNGYDVHSDDMPIPDYIEWQRRVIAQVWRVLKDDGALFYNHKWRVQNGVIQRHAEEILQGYPIRQVIVWQRAGGINMNDGYFVPNYELIYMVAKPNFKLAPKANAVGDVWYLPQETRGNNSHPAPFPLGIPERIVISTLGTVFLDPFAGSGTTLVAAQKHGRRFLGCDISAEYVELARKRLAQPYTVPMFAEDAS